MLTRRELLKNGMVLPLFSNGVIHQFSRPSIGGSKRILIEAHRGNSVSAPENTLYAIEEAIQIGVDRVEIDLEISKDERLVVLHDNTVDRTTNGSGFVSHMSYSDLMKLDAGSWKSDKYRGAVIPLLEDVFDLCKGKVMVNIDLKNAKAAIPMARMIREMNMENEVVITGKVPECSNDIRGQGCFLTMFFESDQEFSRQINMNEFQKAIEAAVVSVRKACLPGFLFHHRWIDEQIVYAAHRHGLAVGVYDVNNKSTAENMILNGVDSIMTDDPELMKEILTRY